MMNIIPSVRRCQHVLTFMTYSIISFFTFFYIDLSLFRFTWVFFNKYLIHFTVLKYPTETFVNTINGKLVPSI